MTKKVAVVLANGFEEIEGLTQVDVLRRAGFQCDMVGLDAMEVTGSHGIQVTCDKVLADDLLEYDLVTFPGGLPGSTNLRDSDKLMNLMQQRAKKRRWNAAMCAAPMVLARYGLLAGHEYTMFPGMNEEHGDPKGNFKEDMVVVDKEAKIITSRGPATALPYSFALAEALGANVDDLKESMLYNFLMEQ